MNYQAFLIFFNSMNSFHEQKLGENEKQAPLTIKKIKIKKKPAKLLL